VGTFFADLWDRARTAQTDTWQWFNGLNREEWLVVLVVTCVCGFACMLGFRSNRL
jgi:disulfide bond formation protein DsbB